MQNNSEIKLVQSPVITHALQAVGAQVTERINSLNIDNLVPTEDSVKRLKETRADLNKELKEYESQRKLVKEGVMSPYNDFEALYKTEISEKYKGAIDKLGDKIDLVEDKIKEAKKQVVKTYFEELCGNHSIDFVTFEKLGIEINLSTTEKKYKEQIDAAVSKILTDLALIDTQEHKAETLVEYKNKLDVSAAIITVKTRKEAEALMAAKIDRTPVIPAAAPQPAPFVPSQTAQTTAATPAAQGIPAELVTAAIRVTGTMAQLQALTQYLKDNQITYTNI